jgi:hypothetical protein
MKEKFNTIWGKRGLDVKHINNKKVRFATKVMTSNILHKCHVDEV